MDICFIGFGHMAKAIAQGLQSTNHILRASAPSLAREQNTRSIYTTPDNKECVANADIIILAVKPSQMNPVLHEIKSILPSHSLLLSIAAGISIAWLENHLPHHAIIRAMPNIAAAVRQSATVMVANSKITEEQKQQADDIFSTVGLTTWVKQDIEIDRFTALSGSGPAYLFLFMEALIAAALDLGIEKTIAHRFTLQTVQGALSLASTPYSTLAALRKQVTSPGGTTEAALKVFKEHHFEKIVLNAMRAAKERAQQLEL